MPSNCSINPVSRMFHRMWRRNNESVFFLYGGYNSYGGSYHGDLYSDVWSYDIKKNKWKLMKGVCCMNDTEYRHRLIYPVASWNNTPMEYEDLTQPSGVYAHAVASFEESMITFGGVGFNVMNSTNDIIGERNQVWEYHYKSRKWRFCRGKSLITGATGVNRERRADMVFINFERKYSWNNDPGSRSYLNGWSLKYQNKMVMAIFGGYRDSNTLYNDIWILDYYSKEWKYLKGPYVCNFPGIYENKGIAASDEPCARRNYVSWITTYHESNSTLYIFGGQFDVLDNVRLNDLFSFNFTDLRWTWLKGPRVDGYNGAIMNNFGRYDNHDRPGPRFWTHSEIIDNKYLLLFGGFGSFDPYSFDFYCDYCGSLNDLWIYSIEIDQWQYVAGNDYLYSQGTWTNETFYPGSFYGANLIRDNETNQFHVFFGYHNTSLFGYGTLSMHYNFTFIRKCFNYYSYEVESCFGHGHCVSENNCSCFEGYNGTYCDKTKCWDYQSNDSMACNSHGNCIAYNNCDCDYGYYGNECGVWYCNSLLWNSSDVCSGRGNCSSYEYCDCEDYYYGQFCFNITCTKFNNCSGNGNCINSVDGPMCNCSEGYYSSDCSSFYCGSYKYNNALACGIGGNCVDYNKCECNTNYKLKDDDLICESINIFEWMVANIIYTLMFSFAFLFIVIFMIIIITFIIIYRIRSKNSIILKGNDLDLKESTIQE